MDKCFRSVFILIANILIQIATIKQIVQIIILSIKFIKDILKASLNQK